jgi:ech hydrogenase subunit E
MKSGGTINMSKRIVLPFGPQHPVLPEPIHLDLIMEDEKVIEAIPSIGFIHRGLEKLVEKKGFEEFVYVAERICGICSFIHGMGYCMAVEHIMGIKISERVEFLRTLWSELSRIHSHLLWLGLLADAFGFESLFMHSWKLREKVLDIFSMTTGGRVIFSVCKIGGVSRDITEEQFKAIGAIMADIEKDFKEVAKVFLNDKSVQHRSCGLGVLSTEDALALGAVGPVARASGVVKDMREMGFLAYGKVDFQIQTAAEGDCYARTKVRILEILESIRIIKRCMELIPAGDLMSPRKGVPSGEVILRLEQPRGQVFYYVKANGTRFLERMKVRTPTMANIPPMVHMLQGVQLADVPIIILTIDPCVSCLER